MGFNPSEKVEVIITSEENGERLDRVFVHMLRNSPSELLFTRATVQEYIHLGVYEGGSGVKIEKPSYRVSSGERFSLDLSLLQQIAQKKQMRSGDAIWPIKPQERALEVVYEDSDVLVLNKPAGVVVHPSIKHSENTLANYVKWYLLNVSKDKGDGYKFDDGMEKAGLVHRLDKDVSGLILFAKTSDAQTQLVKQFKDRVISKYYYARVTELSSMRSVRFKFGVWGKVVGYIKRDPSNRFLRKFSPTGVANMENGAKLAVSYVFWLNANECVVRIETGRTHQIRALFKAFGYAVEGDLLYGERSTVMELRDRLELYAIYLQFTLPSGSNKCLNISYVIGNTIAVQAVNDAISCWDYDRQFIA